MKRFIATLMFTTLPLVANSNTVEQCVNFANSARSVAVARDVGVSHNEALRVVLGIKTTPDWQVVVARLVEVVYTRPMFQGVSPDRIHSYFLVTCLDDAGKLK